MSVFKFNLVSTKNVFNSSVFFFKFFYNKIYGGLSFQYNKVDNFSIYTFDRFLNPIPYFWGFSFFAEKLLLYSLFNKLYNELALNSYNMYYISRDVLFKDFFCTNFFNFFYTEEFLRIKALQNFKKKILWKLFLKQSRIKTQKESKNFFLQNPFFWGLSKKFSLSNYIVFLSEKKFFSAKTSFSKLLTHFFFKDSLGVFMKSFLNKIVNKTVYFFCKNVISYSFFFFFFNNLLFNLVFNRLSFTSFFRNVFFYSTIFFNYKKNSCDFLSVKVKSISSLSCNYFFKGFTKNYIVNCQKRIQLFSKVF